MTPIDQIVANQTSNLSNQTANISLASYCPDFSKILSANGGGSINDVNNPNCSAFQ